MRLLVGTPYQAYTFTPDGRVQERQVSLLEEPRIQWIELNVRQLPDQEWEIGRSGLRFYSDRRTLETRTHS
ncbi:hypothetical protein SLA2020_428980 [Shorea laevis]